MKFTKLTNKQQYLLWTLQDLGLESAVIAGGALRDSYFGNPYKDVDIFVHQDDLLAASEVWSVVSDEQPPADNEKFWQALCDRTGMHWPERSSPSSRAYERNNVNTVWKMEQNQSHHSVEFIVLDCNPIHYIDKYFDVGICKTWFDGKRVHYSKDFMHDAHNQQLTVCGRMDKHERKHCESHYLPRLQKKFPNHSVVYDLSRIEGDGTPEKAETPPGFF
jgi:hypothetical protein